MKSVLVRLHWACYALRSQSRGELASKKGGYHLVGWLCPRTCWRWKLWHWYVQWTCPPWILSRGAWVFEYRIRIVTCQIIQFNFWISGNKFSDYIDMQIAKEKQRKVGWKNSVFEILVSNSTQSYKKPITKNGCAWKDRVDAMSEFHTHNVWRPAPWSRLSWYHILVLCNAFSRHTKGGHW